MQFLSALVLLCVISAMNAAISFDLDASKHPDHPGKCWHPSLKMAFDVGTHHPNHTCLEIDCGKSFSMQTRSCGIVIPPPGYRNEKDLTKEYPDCCSKLIKIDENQEVDPTPA